jgi:metallo-beta-lactamase class B
MNLKTIVTAALLGAVAIAGPATSQGWPVSWSAPAEPYRIVGPIYQVGSQGLGIYLITTKAGNILIDSGVPGWGPHVIENIQKLGFDPKQTKILLNSHAHFDHSGGLA